MTLAAATKLGLHEIKTSIGTGDRNRAREPRLGLDVWALARDNNRLRRFAWAGMSKVIRWLFVLWWTAGISFGQGATAVAPRQTETDEYTRYELLSPESASFAIRYEVTAATAGARYYFNTIRKGSVASGESVVDEMTGEPLRFEIVSGEEAVKDPLMKGDDASVDYIKVHLARPVPVDGQARMLILKTY